MHRRSWLVVPVLLLAGCYHAVVNTGVAPSPKVVEQAWAMGYVAGLIPPPPVDTKTACPRGVSKVETMLSVPNVLVTLITFNIVSPMTIKYTCAQ